MMIYLLKPFFADLNHTMEHSQAHAAQQEASKGAQGIESRGNFLIRGQFFSSCG
jgi:hypothetical protein